MATRAMDPDSMRSHAAHATELERARRRFDDAAASRARAITAAHKDGLSLRQIGRSVGLSHTQVERVIAGAQASPA